LPFSATSGSHPSSLLQGHCCTGKPNPNGIIELGQGRACFIQPLIGRTSYPNLVQTLDFERKKRFTKTFNTPYKKHSFLAIKNSKQRRRSANTRTGFTSRAPPHPHFDRGYNNTTAAGASDLHPIHNYRSSLQWRISI
jgi:hypothetical protein